jgi:hypothetical protein
VVLSEEERTLENRLACFVNADLGAVDCLMEVNECSESAIADCREARDKARTDPELRCFPPSGDVSALLGECFRTVAKDGVDAFLDSRSPRCDCLTNCTGADRDPEVVECMEIALQAEVAVLGLTELDCITKFWRQLAVCFGNEASNEATCEDAETACADLPPSDCAISDAVLDDCLTL